MNKHKQDREAAIAWAKQLVEEGDFVVLDSETTGFDGHPIEIAVIAQSGAVLFDYRIKPPSGIKIDPGAFRAHGIKDDDLRDAPAWDTVAEQLDAVLRGRRLIIYNADFDTRIVRNAIKAGGIFITEGTYRALDNAECAMRMYAQFHGDWNDYHGNYRWQSLSNAASQMKVEVKDAHSALGDCLMTLGVIRAMAEVK